jgi:intracellular sulfur oxidation DsrE/DsrF family protein
MVFNNLAALLKATSEFGPRSTEPIKVVIVSHGPEIVVFAKKNYDKYREIVDRAASFAQQGVRFEICRNAAAAQGFKPEDLYGFTTVVPAGPYALAYWQAKGYSENVIGVLWAEGVLAEIVLFAYGGRITRHLGSVGLITLAGIAAVVRWLGTGLTDSLAAVVVLQALHAFSFGAAHLGAMACIGETVPASLSATAQSLYSGLVWGAGLGLMLLASGWLYHGLGGSAYLAMAAVALAGTFVALRLSALTPRLPQP